jgi:hypothetical protein
MNRSVILKDIGTGTSEEQPISGVTAGEDRWPQSRDKNHTQEHAHTGDKSSSTEGGNLGDPDTQHRSTGPSKDKDLSSPSHSYLSGNPKKRAD